jgi:hypothetical protein
LKGWKKEARVVGQAGIPHSFAFTVGDEKGFLGLNWRRRRRRRRRRKGREARINRRGGFLVRGEA